MNIAEVLKFVKDTKERTNNIKYLAMKNLQEIGEEMLVLSGQSRAPRWEKWLEIHGGYTSRVAAKEDRGDLTIDKVIFDELKTRVLTDKEIKAGKLCVGGQVRLWQKLDNYIFITTNEDTYKTRVWKISADTFKSLYEQANIRFSSSHIAGKSVDKLKKIKAGEKIEWTFVLHTNDYNWSQFEITDQF